MDYSYYKMIYQSLARGMIDRDSYFNYDIFNESIPPSWKLGSTLFHKKRHSQTIDDSICAICMDGREGRDHEGNIINSNPIIYCDMCNIGVHQKCAGIYTIPEGQYICDRCRFLKEGMSSDSH